MNFPLVAREAALVALLASLLSGCDTREQKYDTCLDRAAATCTPVGVRECGLSRSAGDAEFDKCPAYKACEDAAVSTCMSK